MRPIFSRSIKLFCLYAGGSSDSSRAANGLPRGFLIFTIAPHAGQTIFKPTAVVCTRIWLPHEHSANMAVPWVGGDQFDCTSRFPCWRARNLSWRAGGRKPPVEE